ncbi:right-handed parallel beta-helix repeat-containing protein [Mucilaginibacter sp. ZT4R22]|uniref:Right-handed parallel beta-helix repeat-containing protein n=1 Tax=Mucilaginibacter pankratovii TaxID=2772110 RepID=A0ABR7WPK6_9SPHI|nr:right-handed parallel beta-helix repeat-containing protein [Mucilaginibacter pankratovii]MBD1364256.1 right-handed parallel beta-helix repeat-containing protein [Mucilaginibacter pankratovii]
MYRLILLIFINTYLATAVACAKNIDANQYLSSSGRTKSPGKTTYYIDPKKGNDRNPGTLQNRPWRTFDRVNRMVLQPGDKVIVSPGTFHRSLYLIAKGTAAKPVNILFKPGRFDFYPDSAYKSAFHISNTNDVPDGLKAIALYVAGSKFVRVKGAGPKIMLRGKMIESCIDHSEDVSIAGLSYDYYRPTVSEMKITHLSVNTAEIAVNASSAYSIKDSVLYWEGEGWRHEAGWYWQVYDPGTGYVERTDLKPNSVKFSDRGKGMITAHFKNNPGFAEGLIYQTRDVTRDCAGIFMQYSKNIRLKNIRIYFMHGMGVVSQYCENVKMDSVVVRPEETSGRTCAAWADILHFSGCSGKIEVANCYLSGANDDAINVHGTHLRIMEGVSNKQIKVRFMHTQTYGFTAFLPGDSIELVHAKTLNSFAENVVLKAERLNDKEILLTLKDEIPDAFATDDAVENTTRTPRIWVHHTVITRIPTRGILATTRRSILLENNLFDRVRWNAVLIEDDAESWYESGPVRNVLIRNNNFIGCGGPVISVHPENEINDKPVHKNITVINNRFKLNGDSKVLYAKSTSGIQLIGNSIRSATADINQLTEFKDCLNIKVAANKISKP